MCVIRIARLIEDDFHLLGNPDGAKPRGTDRPIPDEPVPGAPNAEVYELRWTQQCEILPERRRSWSMNHEGHNNVRSCRNADKTGIRIDEITK